MVGKLLTTLEMLEPQDLKMAWRDRYQGQYALLLLLIISIQYVKLRTH